MSKYVKDLITDYLRDRFDGVSDALLVNLTGLDANRTTALRAELRSSDVEMLVVKNSLARRATEDSALASGLKEVDGPTAVVWGAEDIVSLAKIITRLAEDPQYAPFAATGGVMDGTKLSPEEVKAVSKWPSREEQLSILCGQILSVGSTLAGQIAGPGGTLVGQVKQKSEGEDEAAAE